jgi:hypothetical protein
MCAGRPARARLTQRKVNAASIASLILTTDCVIVERPKGLQHQTWHRRHARGNVTLGHL